LAKIDDFSLGYMGSLADTGSPVEGAVGALAVAMLVAGAGILALRRTQSRARA